VPKDVLQIFVSKIITSMQSIELGDRCLDNISQLIIVVG